MVAGAGFLSPSTSTAAPQNATATATATIGVDVRDLTVRLIQRKLLDAITVGFAENRITAIVGPTGCGKTTLLRSVNRMHDHTLNMSVDGSIIVNNVDVYGRDVNVRDLRRRVGMLFQRANPFPQSIEDNISIAPRAHGLIARGGDDQLVEQRLTEVGLWDAVKDRLHSSPFTLSGGQQQLLCLARALALEPDVLLLDEPTSALDPGTTEHIEALLRSLRARMTILIVTHNLGQAMRLSDEVVFLMAGKLVETAPTDKFFQAAEDERSREYVSGRIG
jgi:phosphate transport system ATP-binding protein